jgi:CRISPR-associated endonuclease/helicase Cas3
MSNIYYAHSGNQPDKSDWQLLSDHLQRVGNMAKENARCFDAGLLSEVAGLLHDIGKYTSAFQRRLEGGSRVDHATAGAQLAVKKWGQLGKILAYIVAGHHAGLANGLDEGNGRSTLKERLEKQIIELDKIWAKEIDLPNELTMPSLKLRKNFDGFQMAFYIRMLFSCLVDADFIDTERFYLGLERKQPQRGNGATLEELQACLNTYLEQFRHSNQGHNSGKVNILRNEILDYARQQATLAPGLFTMTVPTGGGKTLSSMAFALDHALSKGMRRIIYVIPFTSIIEQNAEVFREVFSNLGDDVVLEHHSAFDDEKFKDKEETKDKLRLAMENWDSPVVVTTAVQFFESLFADRTSKCRKLHNISSSVIILDEAQMLPLKLLRPTMAAIDELARNYHCSVVLCTATQPALLAENIHNGFENVREIAPDPKRLYEEFERVSVEHIGEQTDNDLKQKLEQHPQILLIVNNRRHARALYEQLEDHEGVYHLTTLMYARHRSAVLDEVRRRLKAGLSCKLISTSLIEAGVDVSFPVVMRAETGLDSVAQAAGRCNREGIWSKDESRVWVFTAPDWKVPTEIEEYAAGLRQVIRNHQGNLLAPDAIKSYFEDVYWRKGNQLDEKHILASLREHSAKLSFPFQNIARDYRLIESIMRPVIIPHNPVAEALVKQLRHAPFVGRIARGLQPYLVQVPQQALETLKRAGVVEVIQPDKFGDQFILLNNKDLYDESCGLTWSEPMFLKSESCIID